MTLPATVIAVGALVAAFVSNDFSIKYVYDHSNLVMDRAYTWVALYAGNEGSLLYIVFILALMSALAMRFAPKRFARSMPYTIAILAIVQAFYFFALAFFASPFAPLGFEVDDGRGINPLLTHPGMFSHPPMLMAGLIGITIPFAFATGALIAGNFGDDWVDVARVSSIVVWGILGVGLLLGAWWAYTILGWGGYWGWDPIENVAFMPWLVLTAFIHSIMAQKRRGMFRMWNVALLNIAFVLAQLGMFINRGGPVVSVHSFAASTLGAIFLSFMIVCLIFGFGVFLWRLPSPEERSADGVIPLARGLLPCQQLPPAGGHVRHTLGGGISRPRRVRPGEGNQRGRSVLQHGERPTSAHRPVRDGNRPSAPVAEDRRPVPCAAHRHPVPCWVSGGGWHDRIGHHKRHRCNRVRRDRIHRRHGPRGMVSRREESQPIRRKTGRWRGGGL